MTGIKGVVLKYRKSLSYILASCITAAFEIVIGLFLLNMISLSEVSANTIGIICGTCLHYFIVTKKVFIGKISHKSVAVYLITFLIGLLLQNSVVWVICRFMPLIFGESFRYLIAKGCSLVCSFVVMYRLRKKLYSIINER